MNHDIDILKIIKEVNQMAGKKGGGSKGGSNYRSSISGKYVKKNYAEKHPKTTEKEKRK